MFTGIIEDLGIVNKITRGELTVYTKLGDSIVGDSVAVNGVCLTICRLHRSSNQPLVSFDLSEETLKKTNLGELKMGKKVNLERAKKFGEPLGGHLVTGHIEGTGKILSIKRENNSIFFEFSAPPEFARYLVAKGSIAIDGISLTVADVQRSLRPESPSARGLRAEGRARATANVQRLLTFMVAVIPFTLRNTTLGIKKVGETVNFEPDVLVKYMENILEMKKINPLRQKEVRSEKEINLDLLKKTGFY